jgi:hypothetical protein
MNFINLVFDVHATKPSWVTTNQPMIDFEKDVANSRYRIYVNNDLIVERNWLFDNNTILRENLCLNYVSEIYNLKLEPVIHNPVQIKFNLKNPKVNDIAISCADDQLEFSFKL